MSWDFRYGLEIYIVQKCFTEHSLDMSKMETSSGTFVMLRHGQKSLSSVIFCVCVCIAPMMQTCENGDTI